MREIEWIQTSPDTHGDRDSSVLLSSRLYLRYAAEISLIDPVQTSGVASLH